MGKLSYLITTSLDGYTVDANGNFDWAEPSEEVHAFVNDAVRNVGTFVFGRKMYETMAVWDTIDDDGDSPGMSDFVTIWRAAQKIVYSKSLSTVETADTTLEHDFDIEAIKRLVEASDKDVGIGGPHLAAEAIKANIVDEYHQVIIPILIGGGTHWLPDNVQHKLELVDMRKFANGTVYLRYKKTS